MFANKPAEKVLSLAHLFYFPSTSFAARDGRRLEADLRAWCFFFK
jgi:hypothetical protein